MKNTSGEDDKQASSRRLLADAERFLPLLKEAKDPVELEAILRRIDAELPEGHAKIFDSLVEAYSSGGPLSLLFHKIREAVSDRKDLDAADKERALSDADEFQALFDNFREASDLPRGKIFEFAFLAMLIGSQAGISPDLVRKLRAGLPAELGREGGKKSAPARKINWPWEPHANDLARGAHDRDPTLANGKIASEIERSWKLTEVKCPSHRTLEGVVSKLRKSGELPQRSGSLRKRSGSST